MAASLASTASSENHTAAISPRPSEIPYSGRRGELAPRRPPGHVAGGGVGEQLGDGARRCPARRRGSGPGRRGRVSSPISAPTAVGSRVRGRERFGGLGQRVQVRRVNDQRPAGQRLRRPAGRQPGRPDGPGVHPGEGRGPAAPSSLASTGSGTRVVADADEYALPGRPRRGGDGQQAGPGPFGRVDPAHAKGGKLAAQPGVGLGPARTSATVMPVLPAAQAAVTRA